MSCCFRFVAAKSFLGLLLLCWSQSLRNCLGFSLIVPDKSVSQLLQVHESSIEKLKTATADQVGSLDQEPYSNDVFYLRYCLDDEDGSDEDDTNVEEKRMTKLLETLSWRQGEGKAICEAAVEAVAKAKTGSGGWDNAPVLEAAPNSNVISKYLTPAQCITTTTSRDDLVYCIRAGQIDDTALMGAISREQMVDFFLYTKEVNALVANARSLDQDKLLAVVTANDLSGVSLVGGSSDFRQALSASSKQAAKLYPACAGPTLLCNLPPLLNALVKLFKPLFPPAVTKRLKFSTCNSLKNAQSLTDIAKGSGGERKNFLQELDNELYA